ncbi:MAG: tRNA (adenosine(37)-N6)-dimethylallyltransferase MiaA [Actinobacteria bacterium TMED172]|nr:tRNA (adenosine(37)-N6)-dimethylallyltransferase MiaA [Cellvibrionales bacterium]OUW32183.1 MAG: tRNA (adenosine(37)-N6)-dimethylallyltransferase MiaA [Actinobacteria bacterium TMED172]
MGPTACGKTALAESIAQHFPVEVISVDSALIYRHMDIGTAKPDAEYLARLPHHLIDIRDPDQRYSAADFRRDALPLMADITARGHIPLLVGGTMLYFKVLFEGIAELPPADTAIRQQILSDAEQLGWQAMHQRLAAVDPSTAAALHPNHSQRIQRALEVYYSSGETLSSHQARQQLEALPYRVAQLALWPAERSELHARIAQRFDQILHQGLVDELRALRRDFDLHPGMPSMRSVGYRQSWDYIEQRISEQQLREQGIAATRQLAKRQLTWLRKWPGLHRLGADLHSNEVSNQLIDTSLLKISKLLHELSD